MKEFPSLLFGVASAAASFGAHRVLLAWGERALPALVSKRRPLLIACGSIAVAPAVSRIILLHTQSAVADAVLTASLVELALVLAIALPLLALMGLSEIVKKATGRTRAIAPDEAPSPSPGDAPAVTGRRGAIEAIGGVAVVGATGLAFGWGMTIGRHGYEVREIAVPIPRLPKALDGYVIAQISDVHAGLFVGEREFREGAELIRSLRPDLIVATGDLVDFAPRDAPPLARALADLAPRDGVFAILGNHDYYAGHVGVSEAVRAAGITLLVNEARVIRPADAGGFALLGIDDMWSPRFGGPGPDLGAAAASLPRDLARILLAHQPDAFVRSAGKVALQLSGHTHGGQIRPADLVMRGYVAGRYERKGSILYVNRGFGVAGPPVRLGVPPEITKVVLVAV